MESLKWLAGFIIGAGWSAANIYFTIAILKMSVRKTDPAKLTALVMLKFPVLYLAGFLILMSRAFQISSLLTCIMAAVIAAGIRRIWLKRA